MVLTMSTMASIALILEMICPMPSMVSVPSLRRRIVGCWVRAEVPKGGSLDLRF